MNYFKIFSYIFSRFLQGVSSLILATLLANHFDNFAILEYYLISVLVFVIADIGVTQGALKGIFQKEKMFNVIIYKFGLISVFCSIIFAFTLSVKFNNNIWIFVDIILFNVVQIYSNIFIVTRGLGREQELINFSIVRSFLPLTAVLIQIYFNLNKTLDEYLIFRSLSSLLIILFSHFVFLKIKFDTCYEKVDFKYIGLSYLLMMSGWLQENIYRLVINDDSNVTQAVYFSGYYSSTVAIASILINSMYHMITARKVAEYKTLTIVGLIFASVLSCLFYWFYVNLFVNSDVSLNNFAATFFIIFLVFPIKFLYAIKSTTTDGQFDNFKIALGAIVVGYLSNHFFNSDNLTMQLIVNIYVIVSLVVYLVLKNKRT